MTELINSLKRQIRVYGIESPVNMEMDRTGINFSIKGSHKWVTVDWATVVRSCITGRDVPSYLNGKPYELLQHYDKKAVDRRVKKATKDAAKEVTNG